MSELTVLVADRNPESSGLLSSMLRAHGYRVFAVTSGFETLTSVRSQRPTLIILASSLADVDGLEICRRLKRREYCRHIPLLFVTGRAEEQTEALRLGASDYISVPLRQEEVIARVESHLELGHLRRTAGRQPADGVAAQAAAPPQLAAAPPQLQEDRNGWIRLAMQAGRMYAFEWNVVTDEVVRSHYCAEVLGMGPQAAADTGQNWFRRIHPDDLAQCHQILAILSPAYDAYDTQYRVFRPDGQMVNLRESSRAFFDAEGRLSRIIGMVADITEQVQAESDLEQTQTYMLQLVQKLPLGVALANENGRIEYVNDRFVKDFGYRLDEIAEPDAWWRRAFPDEERRREATQAWQESVESASRQGSDISPRQYQINASDGTLHSVEVFGTALGNRTLMLFDDITEQERSEAALSESEDRFRTMADTAPVLLWVSGPDKLCTFFNKGWLYFTGRTMEQELGNGWAEGVHPEDRDRCVAMYSAAFDARENFQLEYRLRRADGEYRWIADIGTPRFAADGTFAGYIGSGIDITDLKRHQEQMLASQKLESLGVLASGIAHDFNNFLGCILADADITLSELDADSPVRDSLERIEAAAMRASETVRQIMTYTGQDHQDLEPVDVSELVQDILQLLRVCIPKEGKLKIDLPSSLPLPWANAAQIRQVVMNLILNAGEALGDQPGAITISGRREAVNFDRRPAGAGTITPGEYICLDISDTGVGMTEDVRRRIFDPFFTTKFAGRGLGLAAVQGIVRSHGGSIEVTSAPGKGSTFKILLPCNEKPPARVPAQRTLPDRLPSFRGSILIVEDEDTLRLSVAKMLRKRGFSVLEASNGDLAVDLIHAREEDIAVVLLDLTLPGKSSQEVFEELRRTRPEVKVILTSAYGRESVAGPLKALRHENFIRKPYHLSDLVSVVRHALPPGKTSASEND